MTSIGVTGHRILGDLEAITQEIDATLIQIRDSFPAPFVVHSALAEGADRLLARRAFDLLAASLTAVLPLPQADYMADFLEDHSKAEFLDLLARADDVVELPATSTRTAAYEAAGRCILDHSDLLIAVWDGQPPRGQGGTGQIVAEAQQRQIPLFWIKVVR
jgi:hypothetical protein